MKRIKVYSLFSSHEFYRDLLLYPPKNVVYSQKIEPETRRFSKSVRVKSVGKILSKTGLPRVVYLPGASGYDLIHATRGMLVLNKRPWVMDLEHAVTTTNQNFTAIKNPVTRKVIEKFFSSHPCKKLMPHTLAAERTLFHYLNCSKFRDKIEVVYPAIQTSPAKRRGKRGGKVKLLFVGKWFHWKGGKELLTAFDILDKKYDVELVMKCDTVPEEYIKSYGKRRNVRFITSFISREELNSVYMSSDIFVFPTFMDSFGIVMLEAMNFRLPVVTTDFFASPEIVEDGKNGLTVPIGISQFDEKRWGKFYRKDTVHPQIVEGLVEKLSALIEDASLRKRMGECGRRMVEKGKFSIERRNRKLRGIYESSVKGAGK